MVHRAERRPMRWRWPWWLRWPRPPAGVLVLDDEDQAESDGVGAHRASER